MRDAGLRMVKSFHCIGCICGKFSVAGCAALQPASRKFGTYTDTAYMQWNDIAAKATQLLDSDGGSPHLAPASLARIQPIQWNDMAAKAKKKKRKKKKSCGMQVAEPRTPHPQV